MANTKTAVAEPEKKKRGVAKGTKREPRWKTFSVKVALAAENFDAEGALKAYAEGMNLHFQDVTSKNRAGDETGKHTLVIATAPITKRAKPVMSKDQEKNALALFRAAMRDPENKTKLEALLTRSNNGEDTSAEVAALIGV